MSFHALQERVNARALCVFGSTFLLDSVETPGDFLEPGDVRHVGEMAVQVTEPQMVVQSCNVPDGVVGLEVDLGGGRLFNVRDAKADGFGYTTLLLEEGRN